MSIQYIESVEADAANVSIWLLHNVCIPLRMTGRSGGSSRCTLCGPQMKGTVLSPGLLCELISMIFEERAEKDVCVLLRSIRMSPGIFSDERFLLHYPDSTLTCLMSPLMQCQGKQQEHLLGRNVLERASVRLHRGRSSIWETTDWEYKEGLKVAWWTSWMNKNWNREENS